MGNVGSGGDEDDGSGMGWVKKRKAEREARQRAEQEAQAQARARSAEGERAEKESRKSGESASTSCTEMTAPDTEATEASPLASTSTSVTDLSSPGMKALRVDGADGPTSVLEVEGESFADTDTRQEQPPSRGATLQRDEHCITAVRRPMLKRSSSGPGSAVVTLGSSSADSGVRSGVDCHSRSRSTCWTEDSDGMNEGDNEEEDDDDDDEELLAQEDAYRRTALGAGVEKVSKHVSHGSISSTTTGTPGTGADVAGA